MNYLNNIMAKMEADQLGYIEALMLNDQGYVAECTGDNVFIFHKGKLWTPPFHAGALKGVTRSVVLDIAEDLDDTLYLVESYRLKLQLLDSCNKTGKNSDNELWSLSQKLIALVIHQQARGFVSHIEPLLLKIKLSPNRKKQLIKQLLDRVP